MKRRRKLNAKCPSCKVEKHRTEMRIAITQMEAIDRAAYTNHYKELDIDTYASFINSNFDWACDECLDSKKAIKANPNLQNYCWNPYYAYFDTQYQCTNCQTDFSFTKEEKKYWLESLKFWIDSRPTNCVNCRRAIRQLKQENTTISEILSKEEHNITATELETVISVYTTWGKEQKAKYYQSVLKKLDKR